MTEKIVHIDARGMHYTPLNQAVRKAVAEGATAPADFAPKNGTNFQLNQRENDMLMERRSLI